MRFIRCQQQLNICFPYGMNFSFFPIVYKSTFFLVSNHFFSTQSLENVSEPKNVVTLPSVFLGTTYESG